MEIAENSFVMWGERGMVATAFLDLHQGATRDAWSSFLGACQFGTSTAWLNDRVASIRTVVEPDFSNEGFGHPDAIIKLIFESGNAAVVITEAKRLPFDRCCAAASTRGGAGYNSCLNGQLELNHCLALALSEFRDDDSILSEPPWVLHSPYAIDRRGKLRSLKNRVVIEEIARPFSGLPFRSYYHLVITTDDSNPLEVVGNGPHWPELYHPDYPFQNCWPNLRDQFGWISWEAIAKLMRAFVDEAKIRQSLFLSTFEPNRRNFKSSSPLLSEES